MLLSGLLDVIDQKKVTRFKDAEISGLAYDSRLIEPGQAFFCIKGLVTDGHLYAEEAVKRRAAVIFVERELDVDTGDITVVNVPSTREALAKCSSRFYGDPSKKLTLVGITGTNGKTTTTYLVKSIFDMAGYKTGLIGTIENYIGNKSEEVTRTTPESLDLQKLLGKMVDEGVEVTVMEVSSHALELRRATGCDFDVVVFTNLTQDHLDFHISLEDYFIAKKRLFVDEDYGMERFALLNMDDPFGRRLREETAFDSKGFGIYSNSEFHAFDTEIGEKGSSFRLKYESGSMVIKTQLRGIFNVYNCLAAASVGLVRGVDPEDLQKGIESVEGVPGRFQSIDCGQQYSVIVDYAHTPDGVRNLLEASRAITKGKVISVVGCGGDRDRSKRPLMGEVGAALSDLCIFTSDNPRSEDPENIIEMMVEGVRGKISDEKYMVVVDRRSAIEKAISIAGEGDCVVIAGKGHERGQIFNNEVIPFDDRVVAKECIVEVEDESP